MSRFPDPNTVFPNEYGTTCFLKNVITAPNIFVGDYTYYDDAEDPTAFERKNVLFNWPAFGDRLVIGKFCAIASGVRFIMAAPTTACAASALIRFPSLAGPGRRTRRRIFLNFPLRAIQSSETTCGLAERP